MEPTVIGYFDLTTNSEDKEKFTEVRLSFSLFCWTLSTFLSPEVFKFLTRHVIYLVDGCCRRKLFQIRFHNQERSLRREEVRRLCYHVAYASKSNFCTLPAHV